jgi:amidohydrolase
LLDIETLKHQVIAKVEQQREKLVALSRKIHSNPELAFHETKAAGWLCSFLEENGFTVERGICDMPTAFRAWYGKGRPVIAFLAEYDALPGIGHACGHNIISVASTGAGIAAKTVIDSCGGSAVVIGTPAEELSGGKAIMAQRGAFDGLDIAMMIHPGGRNIIVTEALACHGLTVEFFGREAHAASRPEAGINALEAMIQSFNAINSLRQHVRSKARVHGIITDGGQAANIVPAHSAASFLVRAPDEAYLDVLKEKVLNCFTGAAVATGARLEYKWDDTYYAPLLNNITLGRLFLHNMARLGRRMELSVPDRSFGSTDFGNVSQLVPGIHPIVAISRGIAGHTPQFAAAAISEPGMKSLTDSAKALALTAVDLLTTPELVEKVTAEFHKNKITRLTQ